MYADIQGASEEKYHDENCIYFCPHVPDKYCEFLLKYQRPWFKIVLASSQQTVHKLYLCIVQIY